MLKLKLARLAADPGPEESVGYPAEWYTKLDKRRDIRNPGEASVRPLDGHKE